MERIGLLAALLVVPFVFAQEQAIDRTAVGAKSVYVVAFRTPAHVRTSSPEVFHTAAADVRKILTDGHVLIAEDKERGFIENESQMSVGSMAKLADEAGAGSLLFVTVDRPTSKWIKLTGEQQQKAKTNIGSATAATIGLGISGLMIYMSQREAWIREGAAAKGYIAEDVIFAQSDLFPAAKEGD